MSYRLGPSAKRPPLHLLLRYTSCFGHLRPDGGSGRIRQSNAGLEVPHRPAPYITSGPVQQLPLYTSQMPRQGKRQCLANFFRENLTEFNFVFPNHGET